MACQSCYQGTELIRRRDLRLVFAHHINGLRVFLVKLIETADPLQRPLAGGGDVQLIAEKLFELIECEGVVSRVDRQILSAPGIMEEKAAQRRRRGRSLQGVSQDSAGGALVVVPRCSEVEIELLVSP